MHVRRVLIFDQMERAYSRVIVQLFYIFQKILYDRIEELRGRIHKAHNPVYNESLMIEIETLQWVLAQILMLKQQ